MQLPHADGIEAVGICRCTSRHGRSLGERVRVAVPPDPAAPIPTAGQRQGATHCWVQDPPEAPGRWPALLLRWSRSPGGAWRGQVAYAFLRGTEVVLVETWLDAEQLRRR